MAKILLSVFSCGPHRGSEPGIGWNWAVELATSGHEVWVLTWPECRRDIDVELEKQALPNLCFVHYPLSTWLAWWQQGQRGMRLYYNVKIEHKLRQNSKRYLLCGLKTNSLKVAQPG
jgi:hypothetical protein